MRDDYEQLIAEQLKTMPEDLKKEVESLINYYLEVTKNEKACYKTSRFHAKANDAGTTAGGAE